MIPKYALKYSCTDYDDDDAKDNRYPIIIRYQKFMYPRKMLLLIIFFKPTNDACALFTACKMSMKNQNEKTKVCNYKNFVIKPYNENWDKCRIVYINRKFTLYLL